MLGYRIQVVSRIGRGSVFRFETPTAPGRPLPSSPTQAPELPTLGLAGRLFVVVDDESAIVAGMRVLLGGWGAEVVGSSTGDDVLGQLEAIGRLPDLIIVDYRLADGRLGTDVIDRLRDVLDPEIPAIIATGLPTPDLADQVRARGDDLLLKPILPSDLRALIDTKLRRPTVR
jgi:CheY-like chemotaxis protein